MTKLFFIVCIFSTFMLVAQNDSAHSKRYVDYGLVRIQGNLALGKNLKYDGTNMYWAGDLDYYIRGNVSISSGFYYSFGSFGGKKEFKENHSAYLGASYHFKTNNHLDPYIGILPGYSINQLNANSIAFSDTSKPVSTYPWAFNPLFSVSAGLTYYANRFFNVFVNVQYQTGKHYSDVAPVSLEELKIKFGLGYMLWARKKYVRFRKPNDKSQ